MTDVILDPALWESLEAGNDALLAEWLVTEGDRVHAGQTLARASLLHTMIDVPAAHAGTVEEIAVPAGERFPRGMVLARLIPT